jgi:hypothetical protein
MRRLDQFDDEAAFPHARRGYLIARLTETQSSLPRPRNATIRNPAKGAARRLHHALADP